MKVTITQLPDGPSGLEEAMAALARHVKTEGSHFLLLPEMPFFAWLAYERPTGTDEWQAAVDAHTEWMSKLASLEVETIVGSKPTVENGNRHNDAFILDQGNTERFLHRKYYLPDEPGFWEASWYERADQPQFQSLSTGELQVGAMICSDIWFGEHARAYARQGVQLLVNPRATESGSLDKWLAGGRAAAVMSGAYCLSSNRSGPGKGFDWGGMGWIIDPNGNVLAQTSDEQPFVTLEIDLSLANKAKSTYPRYVKE